MKNKIHEIRAWEAGLIYVPIPSGYGKTLLNCYWNKIALKEIAKLKKS